MDDSISVIWQVIPHEVHYLVVFFMSSAQSFTCSRVLDRSLLSFNATPRIAVTSIKSSLFAVTLQPNRVCI
jgi:hypothetical protein